MQPTFNWAIPVHSDCCKQAICHTDNIPFLWLDTVAMIYLADTLVGHDLNSAANNFFHTKVRGCCEWMSWLYVDLGLPQSHYTTT